MENIYVFLLFIQMDVCTKVGGCGNLMPNNIRTIYHYLLCVKVPAKIRIVNYEIQLYDDFYNSSSPFWSWVPGSSCAWWAVNDKIY